MVGPPPLPARERGSYSRVMARLPAHHVARTRLVARLAGAPVALVEAPSGYGKSVLAAELRAATPDAAVTVACAERHDDPEVFAGAVADALGRAGVTVAPAALADELIDAVLAALARAVDRVTIVVDDAHHVGRAAPLLVRLVEQLPEPHLALVLARRLPDGAARLRPLAGAAILQAADLACTVDETAALARGLGAAIDEREAQQLHDASAGWPVAIVLFASERARGGATDRIEGLVELIDDQLARLDEPTVEVLVASAHLPWIDDALAARLGAPRFVECVTAAGVPLVGLDRDRVTLPGSLADRLCERAALGSERARVIAEHYAERHAIADALRVGDAAACPDVSCRIITGCDPVLLEQLPASELAALVERIDDATLLRYPRVLLRLVARCETVGRHGPGDSALGRAEALAGRIDDAAAAREIAVVRARVLARDGRTEEAVALARQVLEHAAPNEQRTRAQAYDVLATSAAWAFDDAAVREAVTLYSTSIELYLAAGDDEAAVDGLCSLGYQAHYTLGHHDAAIDAIQRGAALTRRADRRASAAILSSEIYAHCGRYAEAEDAVTLAEVHASRTGDPRLMAYVAWERARMASQRGERDATVASLRTTELHPGDWLQSHTGAYFLADAAQLLDRVGERDLADRYLDRARDRDDAPDSLAQAEAAVLARRGDPAEARAAIAKVFTVGPVEARERWRMRLLEAYAALRAGHPDAGSLAARAFDDAAALGAPELPFVQEQEIAQRLVAVAADAGSAAAATLTAGRLSVTLSVLGRVDLLVGGRAVALPSGLPAQLVKVLAASGGRAPAEAAMEALWPDVDPVKSRTQLRKVLNRLHSALDIDGDLVERDGETLVLADHIRIDAATFEAEARVALARRDPMLARSALALYRGPMLPDDPYDEWAVLPRQRLRQRSLALIDLLLADARSRDDVDAALALLERAIAEEPDDEAYYLDAARLLLAAGRDAQARSYLRRAARALDVLGLPPSAEHQRLLDATSA